jgi:hypothetical protein
MNLSITMNKNFIYLLFYLVLKVLWGLGIGDWGLGPIPNPQSPIPNPQSPIPNKIKIF